MHKHRDQTMNLIGFWMEEDVEKKQLELDKQKKIVISFSRSHLHCF